MEIKNKLTVTRGEKGGGKGKRRGRGKQRNMYGGLTGKGNGGFDCGSWGG